MSVHTSPTLLRSAALLLTLATAACGRESADAREEATPQPASVGPENIAVVAEQLLATGPAISGSLQPEREATLRAQVAGQVTAVLVDQGSRVRAGQVLARIDDRTVRDAFLSARSGYTTAENSAQLAARELQRSERLNQSGAIADRDLEQARINNNSAQSQLADAKARLTLAEKQLADAEVRAPFSGIVNTRQVSTGDVVQLGGELMTVVDPSSMQYEAAVPASDLTQVRVGAPVVFTVNGYPGRTFTGRVARVSPTADQATGQVRLAVSVPNASNNLVGGLFADGRITAVSHMAMTAPFNAVDNRGIRPWVLLVKGGKAERREVDLGVRDEATERWEIKTGVAGGDTLLVGSAQGLTPGTPVRVAPPIADQPASKSDSSAQKK